MLSALNTWAQIMATFIGVIVALYQALLYYSREKREEQQINIAKLTRELIHKILLWGALEDVLRPPELGGWSRPTTRIIPFNIEGKWKRPNIDSIKHTLKDVTDEFYKAYKKMYEEFKEIGFHPAINALFNSTYFRLHRLFHSIYSEFPLPPGSIEDLKIEETEDLVRFEEKIDLLLKWKEYFDEYFDTVVNIYYELSPIPSELSKIEAQSLETFFEKLVEEQEIKKHIAILSSLKKAVRIYYVYMEHEQMVREAFFDKFFEIKNVINEIEDSIKVYNRYKKAGKASPWFVIALLAAFITGVLAPLISQLIPKFQILLNNVAITMLLFIFSLVAVTCAMILIFQQYKHS